MKDKLKSGGDAIKTLIKTGGDVADKVLDKGTDVAAAMMNHTTGLIAKLSDDIGVMADRILATEQQIGLMADRIVKTEELMAKLTATLAGKELVSTPEKRSAEVAPQPVVLSIEATVASARTGPKLAITGEPQRFLMYVSTSPMFREGSTVISRVTDARAYDAAWKRSIEAIWEPATNGSRETPGAMVVSIAVKCIVENDQLSAMSNSVDVTVQG